MKKHKRYKKHYNVNLINMTNFTIIGVQNLKKMLEYFNETSTGTYRDVCRILDNRKELLDD